MRLRRAARLVAAAIAVCAAARDGEDGASVTVWDFVVVGAGTGGALAAARLAASGAEVLLLEAGKWDGEWLYDIHKSEERSSLPNVWAYPTRLPGHLTVQNSKEQRTRVLAGRLMGGSSAIHGDVYDRPPLREFEYGGIRSWDEAALKAAFARIEADLTLTFSGEEDLEELADPQLHVVDLLLNHLPLPHHPRGNADGGKGGLTAGWTMFRDCNMARSNEGPLCKRHTSYRDLVPRWNGTAGGASAASLTVAAHALVSRVLFEGLHAVGVEVVRHGRTHEVFARRGVLLAAGAIGTPKILLLSGIGDPLELQRLGVEVVVANREVGQELADHLALFAWFMISGVSEFDPKSKMCAEREHFNLFFNLTGPPSGGDGPVDAEVRIFSGCNLTRRTIDFGVEAVLLHPDSRGRVVVPSASPEVMPVVEFPPLWQRDFARLEWIYGRLADAVGLRVEEFSHLKGRAFTDMVRQEAYLYQHFCCSARVAPEGSPGVCDESLRVRGVEGLYVADAAALPFLPSAHTSAPALLMGELAAASALRDPRMRPLPARALAAAEGPAAAQARAVLLAGNPPAVVEVEVPTVPLRQQPGEASAVAMPMVGLGTGTLSADRVIPAVALFLRLGGRHLDMAVMYANYGEVRAGMEASGIQDLSSVVITWKVMPLGREYVKKAIASAIQALRVDSLAVALLHWPGDISSGKLLHGDPVPSCVDVQGARHSWKACRRESYSALLEEQRAGRVRAIGVSNFAGRHLDELAAEGHPPPAVHQMELHPLWHKDSVLQRHQREGTVVQAYGCLGSKHAGSPLLRMEVVRKIAENRNLTAPQVLLRWAVQRGFSVIAGGSSDAHVAENLKLFHFELTEVEMDFLNAHPQEAMQKMYGPMPEEIW